MPPRFSLDNIVGTIPAAAAPLKVTLPGGAVISSMSQKTGPNMMDQVRSLLSMAAPAMAPLTPIFDIIGALIAIKDFALSVPKVVTNPGAVLKAGKKVVEKVSKLLALIPQASVPLMVRDLVDTIISLLEALSTELNAVVAQQARIEAARAAVASAPAMAAVLAAAEAQQAVEQANLMASLGNLAPIIELVNAFMELIGLPGIPLGSSGGQGLEEIASTLSELTRTLKQVRGTIPL